jgi:hypothetical protein
MKTPTKVVLLAGTVLLAVAALNPPWIVTGVKSRMNFDDFPRTSPRMVTDTVQWRVLHAFLFSPPTLDMSPDRLTELQLRRSKGDKTVGDEWKRETQRLETRANVPAELRTVWLPTSPGTPEGSFRKTLVSSEFEVQWGYLVFRLLFIAIVTAVIAGITALILRTRKPDSV